VAGKYQGITMSVYRLAQLNIARMKEPRESPLMADFVANLDRINALAEQAPGFVWRLKDDDSSAATLSPFSEDYLVNMSLWYDEASLSDYAFKSGHVEIMRRRREWFEVMTEAHAVLWWVVKDHVPTLAEAKDRLDHLRGFGATPRAFAFKKSFAAPDVRRQIGASCAI
jgi:hypothetical protein